jgi:hypothetical protein
LWCKCRNDAGEQRAPIVIVNGVKFGADQHAAHREQLAEMRDGFRRDVGCDVTFALTHPDKLGEPLDALGDIRAHLRRNFLVATSCDE